MLDRHGFSIGDRVVCTKKYSETGPVYEGMTGIVCHIHDLPPQIGVLWDEKLSRGHNCNGNCKNGFGWYMWPDSLENTERIDASMEIEIESDEMISFLFS